MVKIPKLSDMKPEVLTFDDENRPRLHLDFSDGEEDLSARSDTNKAIAHQKDIVEQDKAKQLDHLFDDIFKPAPLNMRVIATMVTQMNPVEDIASTFGVTRQDLINFVEESCAVKFIDFVARFQCKPKSDLRRWQFESAERGNPQMLAHLGKHVLGQLDKPKQANAPVIIIEKTDLGQLPQKPIDK